MSRGEATLARQPLNSDFGDARRLPVAAGERVRALLRRLAGVQGREFRAEADRLLDMLDVPDPEAFHDSALMLKAASHFGAHFAAAAGTVLAQEMAWSGEAQEFAEWSARALDRWGTIAGAYARLEAAATERHDTMLARLLATAIAEHGDAVKWHAIAGLSIPGFGPLNELHRLAERAGLAREEVELVFNGVAIRATPEAFYARALLFGALCPGSFSRQEMEVADSWLLTWGRRFAVVDAAPPGEPPIAIAVGEGGGVKAPGSVPAGAVRYLAGLRGLREMATDVRAAFHAGRLHPGTGCAAKLRVEHHVWALERLDEALADWMGEATRSESRVRIPVGQEAPGCVGLDEILGIGAREGGRRFVVTDLSPSGMGLSVPRGDDDYPLLGDIVAVRHGGALLVGRVVRRQVDPDAERVKVGVRLLARNPARVALCALGARMPAAVREVPALFLPGTDGCGRHDALALPRAAFLARGPYELSLGNRTYRLRFNRDQVSGRGWSAARFEVTSARGR